MGYIEQHTMRKEIHVIPLFGRGSNEESHNDDQSPSAPQTTFELLKEVHPPRLLSRRGRVKWFRRPEPSDIPNPNIFTEEQLRNSMECLGKAVAYCTHLEGEAQKREDDMGNRPVGVTEGVPDRRLTYEQQRYWRLVHRVL